MIINIETTTLDRETDTQVWVEKYRPANFDDIVLDPLNRKIMENIINQNYFPNLLLYGPPGTGKTTTIINLVNRYQDKNNQRNKGLMIHLNASDERGIDIIRNQINQFVNSQSLFHTGTKFVILDEVDYMTKYAQQALKYLLQSCGPNIKFFLICNYISKIDVSLQQEFICIRFNQLPQQQIHAFMRDICNREKLSLTDANIQEIQQLYNSDIRSMINFIQLNQEINSSKNAKQIITKGVWERLYIVMREGDTTAIKTMINNISIQYNIDKKQIVRDFYNYIIIWMSGYSISKF
jgi:replication factor C subunit 3/5